MVLQNKHKARASRRYNAARGGISDGRGRGGHRGRGGLRINNQESFPSLDQAEVENDSEDSHSSKEGEDDSNKEGKGNIESKYTKRKIQSNAWRYIEPEKDPKEDGEEAEEEEDEVDLSGLLERVARLDSSRTSKALSSREKAESSLQEVENDIDHSLLHLLEKQRDRERRRISTRDEEQIGARSSNRLTTSELKMLEMEGKKLLEEKEREKKHYGRAQGLKSQQSKTISINIGENQRKKEEPIKKRVNGNTDRQMNLSALYGNEEDENDDSIRSTSEADLPLQNKMTIIPHQDSPNSVSKREDNNVKSSSAPSKEHEDFLDSII